MPIETTHDAYKAFDEFIREMTVQHIVVAGETIDPAKALREQFPITYRCAFNDWADAEGIDTDALDGEFTYHHGG